MKAHILRVNRISGFTVLELLIALCILSLFSIYATSAYHQVRRMSEVTHRLERTDSAVAVQSYVRSLVSSARAIMVKTSGQSKPVVAFNGEESRLALITASDGTLETGGLYSATLEMRLHGDGLADFVTSRKTLRAISSSNIGVELLLAEIGSLHFRYFGEAEGETSPSWQTRWVNRETLPGLVEVTISMPTGRGQFWPELIARPMSGP
jgi:prepilin-type N-terminal cleavage/methylation domain-containing protein